MRSTRTYKRKFLLLVVFQLGFIMTSSLTQSTTAISNAEAINLNVLNERGGALVELGNYTEAIVYFDKALAIDPNASRLFDSCKNIL
jgi:tetratricopeptide (TPR) repeat protein